MGDSPELTSWHEARWQLPDFADLAPSIVRALAHEVPAYAEADDTTLATTLPTAVATLLEQLSRTEQVPGAADVEAAPAPGILDLAEAFGRRAASVDRSLDTLLAAYRVGGRVVWQFLSGSAVAARLPPDLLADLATRVFSLVDQLSAASARGFHEQVGEPERERTRRRAHLAQVLTTPGTGPAEVREAAGAAGWSLPDSLVCVLVPLNRVPAARAAAPSAVLEATVAPGLAALLVPLTRRGPEYHAEASAPGWFRVLTSLASAQAPVVVGPAGPWERCPEGVAAAVRLRGLVASGLVRASGATERAGVFSAGDHLAPLLLGADPLLAEQLVHRRLGPLLRRGGSGTRRLVETLLVWSAHHGRREEAAHALHVHPQTVRYRMGLVREALGADVDDPQVRPDLTMACRIYLGYLATGDGPGEGPGGGDGGQG